MRISGYFKLAGILLFTAASLISCTSQPASTVSNLTSANVLGTWAGTIQVNGVGTINTSYEILGTGYFYDNYSDEGTWSMNGGQITLYYQSGTVYTSTSTSSSSMSGNISFYNGNTGTFSFAYYTSLMDDAALDIANSTGYFIENVGWIGGDGVEYWIGQDLETSDAVNGTNYGINNGNSYMSPYVNPGTSYVYFTILGNSTRYKSASEVTVPPSQAIYITINPLTGGNMSLSYTINGIKNTVGVTEVNPGDEPQSIKSRSINLK